MAGLSSSHFQGLSSAHYSTGTINKGFDWSSIPQLNTNTNASSNLTASKEIWDAGFEQRQKEADRNAERAFKFRDLESVRNFGQEKDLSKQGFEQDRTIRGDELASQERRQTAQFQAQERMADLNQRLQQRQQESERSAAMSVFRSGRR